MDKITKQITIVKTIENKTINYMMNVTDNIDKDELVGILTGMINTVVTANQVPQAIQKDKRDYIG